MGLNEGAPIVEIGRAGADGMAHITLQLIEKSVTGSPELARKMRGTVALCTTDYRTSVTVRFEGSRVVIDGEDDPRAWLRVEGEAIVLARLAGGGAPLSSPRKLGVKVHGPLRHPLFAWRLHRLLNG